MRFALLLTLPCSVLISFDTSAAEPPSIIKHVTAYSEPGRFVGWPANHGAWSWGDEFLVCFSRGYSQDNGIEYHVDKSKPEDYLLARSRDGGATWTTETPNPPGALNGTKGQRHAAMPAGLTDEKPTELTEPINFGHPNFAMIARLEITREGRSRYSYSYDRGKTWRGPYFLPLFGHKGVMARTDYIVNGPQDCFLFITATKSDGLEGRPITVRTTDGGLTWKQIGFIGPELPGFAVTPSTVRTSPNDFITSLRMREGERQYIDVYASHDQGANWSYVSTPTPTTGEGNPPSMVKLPDGRLALTYGVRARPFRVEAKLSSDRGKTWSDPFLIRGPGGSKDCGYARSFVRTDGKIVTVYVFLEEGHLDCTLQATIWDAGSGR